MSTDARGALYRIMEPPLIMAIALLFLVYAPVYQYDFLYHDDWLLGTGRGFNCQNSPFTRWLAITGRALNDAVSCFDFGLITTVEDARGVRLLTVIVIGGLLATIYRFVRREGLPA